MGNHLVALLLGGTDGIEQVGELGLAGLLEKKLTKRQQTQ
jgi:hypothetical protein